MYEGNVYFILLSVLLCFSVNIVLCPIWSLNHIPNMMYIEANRSFIFITMIIIPSPDKLLLNWEPSCYSTAFCRISEAFSQRRLDWEWERDSNSGRPFKSCQLIWHRIDRGDAAGAEQFNRILNYVYLIT